MRFCRILFFHKKSTIFRLFFIILLGSLIFSNTTYQYYLGHYQLVPNVFTWLLILCQDITTGVHLIPIIYTAILFFCIEVFTRDTFVTLRFLSIKDKYYFLLNYSLLLPFLFVFLLMCLVFLMGLVNSFSFSISSIHQPLLSEVYEISYVSNFQSILLPLFSFLCYLIFLSEIALFNFLLFQKGSTVMANLFSFLLIQSVFWFYPINATISQVFPIHHYILKSVSYHKELLYWLILLLFFILLNLYKIRNTEWEE